MKKISFLGMLAAAALAMTSCQEEVKFSVVTFDDVTVPANSHWTPDEKDNAVNSFTVGNCTFESYKDVSDWGTYYYGFTVSSEQDTEFKDYNDAYKSACGGAKSGKQFAVWNASYSGGDAIKLAEAEVVPGMYVNNNIYAYNSMLNGDAYAKKFGADDWFKLTITGLYNGKEVENKVEFYLAKDGVIVKDWTFVDLSQLGAVNELHFALSSTDNSDYGMNTPAYFCIDNFGAKK